MKNKKIKKQKLPVAMGDHRIIYLLFLVIIPLVLYFRVVNFGLSGLDDSMIIKNINNAQGSPLNLKEAFKHDNFMSNDGIAFYRPITTISFMLDALWGGQEPWTYHLSNLIFHLLNVIALFFFLKKTGIKEEISFLLSLLFSVNPMFSNVVAWIPVRGDLLLCLFSLLSFMTFIEYFKSGKKVYFILHAIVIAVAIFSKEAAVLLPAIILLYYYFVLKKKFRLKEISPFLIGWFIIIVIFYSLRQSVLKASLSPAEFGIIPFIKNLPVIPITLGKFFIPYNLCTMPSINIISTIIGIILMIVLTVLIIKAIHGDKRIFIWGALWFFAFSIPPIFFRSVDLILGIVQYDYLDYRAYLPISGLLVIIGFIINEWSQPVPFKKMLLYFMPIFIIYSFITYNYSTVYSDPISFYTSAINANPGKFMLLETRGGIYYDQGNMQKAMIDFDNSIRIFPAYSIPYFDKGLIYQNQNDYSQAENSFSLALKYDTLYKGDNFLHERSYLTLSLDKLILGKYDEAIVLLKNAIIRYPDINTIHLNLASVYSYIGKFDSALDQYNKGIESSKDLPEYYNNRGMIKDSLMDFAGAIKDFSKALEINQDFIDALKNRGMSKIRAKDNEGAVNDLTTAIIINPNMGESWYYRGLAYYKLNKKEKAAEDWAEARKLGFKEPVSEK